VDAAKGEVTEVILPPLDVPLTDKDREVVQKARPTVSAAPLSQKGPRRLAADPNGDHVWVAEYWSDRLAKINIKTKQIKEYRFPHLYTHPYAAAVDKNHMVWICFLNTDRIAKFNPFTETFTEFPLPTLGSEARHIFADNSTDPPTIWVAYNRVNKLARVEFRKMSGARTETKRAGMTQR
jgi:streptogramin lyase